MLSPAIYHNRGETIYPIDTYVDGGNASVNYSTATLLWMKTQASASFIRYPILQFYAGDLKRFKVLRVYFSISGGIAGQTVIVDVIYNVNISTVTYSTGLTVISSAIASKNIVGVSFVDIDISSYMASYSGNIITFRLRAGVEETNVIRIYSNENTQDLRPRLITR